jgi:hypothetical protein
MKERPPLMDNISRKTIASHLSRVYLHSQMKIKMQYLAKQDMICFTQDAWTAPNVTAFMAVTAHFINEKFELIDLKLAIPHVQGMQLH